MGGGDKSGKNINNKICFQTGRSRGHPLPLMTRHIRGGGGGGGSLQPLGGDTVWGWAYMGGEDSEQENENKIDQVSTGDFYFFYFFITGTGLGKQLSFFVVFLVLGKIFTFFFSTIYRSNQPLVQPIPIPTGFWYLRQCPVKFTSSSASPLPLQHTHSRKNKNNFCKHFAFLFVFFLAFVFTFRGFPRFCDKIHCLLTTYTTRKLRSL